MNNVALRIGAATSTLLAVGLLSVPASLAADCTIAGNGFSSHNTCKVKTVRKTILIKLNKARVSNFVGVFSNTGGHTANGNTGGGVTIVSGSSSVSVSISNTVNQ